MTCHLQGVDLIFKVTEIWKVKGISGKYYPKQTGTGILMRNKGSIRYKALIETREGYDRTFN